MKPFVQRPLHLPQPVPRRKLALAALIAFLVSLVLFLFFLFSTRTLLVVRSQPHEFLSAHAGAFVHPMVELGLLLVLGGVLAGRWLRYFPRTRTSPSPRPAPLLAFQRFAEELGQSHDVEGMRRVFLQAVASRFHPAQVLILGVEAEGQRFRVEARLRPAPPAAPSLMTRPQGCPALRKLQPFRVADTASEARCHCELDVPRTGSYLCLPLKTGGRLQGLVSLSAPPRHWTSKDSQWAECYVSQLARQLANQQLLAQAQQQAMMDDLTRLYNRRFAEEYLQKLLALGARTPRPL